MNTTVSLFISVDAPELAKYKTHSIIKDFIIDKGWQYEERRSGINVLLDAKDLSLFAELPKTDGAIIKIKCNDDIFESALDKDSRMFELYVFDGKFSLSYPGRVNDSTPIKYYIGLDGNKGEIQNFKKAITGLMATWGGTEFEENVSYEINIRENLISDDCLRYRFNVPSTKAIPLSELANLTTGYPNVKFTFEMFYKEEITAGFEVCNGEFLSAYSACEDVWEENTENLEEAESVEVKTEKSDFFKYRYKHDVEIDTLDIFGIEFCFIVALLVILFA